MMAAAQTRSKFLLWLSRIRVIYEIPDFKTVFRYVSSGSSVAFLAETCSVAAHNFKETAGMAHLVDGKKMIRVSKWICSAGGLVGLFTAGNVHASPIDIGNEDVVINWDQTLRYNLGTRVKQRDLNGPGSTAGRDEGEFTFDRGDLVANRIDLFSEFDVTYKKKLGIRVSGSAWYDAAYGSQDKSNPALASVANYPGNNYSPYIKRYYRGPSAEFNDAFVWGNVALPAGEANIKVGRFGMLWGEAVFGAASANSIAASMAPSDGQKASISPGATAKETLLPIGQISANIPLTKNVELGAQYTLEYRASRGPEGGTYFGSSDVALNGPVVNYAGTVPLLRNDPLTGRKGDVGFILKYSPSWMDGTIGLVRRRFDDKGLAYVQASVPQGFYRFVSNRDVNLYGATVNTTLFGLAVGGELSYRTGQGLAGSLNSTTLQPPRGDTIHGLINAIKSFGQTSVWSTAALTTELTWTQLRKVTDNPTLYQGNAAACVSSDITAGCPTKNAYHLAVAFSPSWQQAASGIDLSMPLIYQRGLKGNAAASGSAINEGSALYSAGLSASIYNKYTVALSYTGYSNRHRGSGPSYVNNGASALYDRNWVGLSLQTNF